MKLNTEKIKKELKDDERTKTWLARKVGISPQSIRYILRTGSTSKIDEIAAALGVEPQELVIW